MSDAAAARGVVRAQDARTLIDGPLGAYLLAGEALTGGVVTLVVHTLAPRALGSPVHTHRNEDEWTYILSGRVGVELGGQTSVALPGDAVLKPRAIPHAFWNAGDEPARLLEVITPAGFEGFFERLAEVLTGHGAPDLVALVALAAAYDVDLDPASVPRLAAAHQLRLG